MFGREIPRRHIDFQRHAAHFGGDVGADQIGRLPVADIFVMQAHIGLGRRRVDRFGQDLSIDQAFRQADPADAAGFPVIVPAAADQIAAHDGFERQGFEPARHHRAADHWRALIRIGDGLLQSGVRLMVRDDVAGAVEPEIRHIGQHPALVGNRRRQHHIEGRQPIGGDDQDLVIPDRIHVADLAPGEQFQAFQVGLQHWLKIFLSHKISFKFQAAKLWRQAVGVESNLHVYGPRPIREITERMWSPDHGVFWYDVLARTNHPMSIHAFHSRGGKGERPAPVVEVFEYEQGKVAEGKGWTCHAWEVKHAQPYIECYGFRFETDEGIVAFSGDTAPIAAVVELARDADLFVMEAVHREEKIQTYPSVISESGTLSAGRMAAEAGAKRLVINHQSGTLEPHEETTQGIAEVKEMFDGLLFWAQDMMDVEWN